MSGLLSWLWPRRPTPSPAPWTISLAPNDLDPYLAATLWAIEQGHTAMIAGPEAYARESVHAKALVETMLALDGSHLGPVAQRPGLGIVLAAPTRLQLERLDRHGCDPTARWFLILSETDPAERELQEAWFWAHSRPAPAESTEARESAASDPSGLLTDAEHWALSVRAGLGSPPRRFGLRALGENG